MRTLTALFLIVATAGSALAESFKSPAGLQLYSLRNQFKLRGVDWTLDRVKEMGITEVELAGTYDKSIEEFSAALRQRGLTAVSTHFGYGLWKNQLATCVADAKKLGVKFAGCAWIDHKDAFDEAECRDAIAVFSKAAQALSAEGIQFFYHAHGFEFEPHGDGTLFDLFMKETDPKVGVEMDVLWIVFPGQDPVKLLEKYGQRWVLMHLKDLKKGVATGVLTGKTDTNNDVALGTGQVNWPAVLAAAEKVGIKHYFIEDESDGVMGQVPQTLSFLKTVTW